MWRGKSGQTAIEWKYSHSQAESQLYNVCSVEWISGAAGAASGGCASGGAIGAIRNNAQ